MKRIVLFLVGLLLIGCSSHYSEGYRCGVVRKFSKKGIFIKSWEGELLLGGVVATGGKNSTLVNEIFDFSVDPNDPKAENIAKVIIKAMDTGERVRLSYIENTILKIRADSNYFVQSIEFVEESK